MTGPRSTSLADSTRATARRATPHGCSRRHTVILCIDFSNLPPPPLPPPALLRLPLCRAWTAVPELLAPPSVPRSDPFRRAHPDRAAETLGAKADGRSTAAPPPVVHRPWCPGVACPWRSRRHRVLRSRRGRPSRPVAGCPVPGDGNRYRFAPCRVAGGSQAFCSPPSRWWCWPAAAGAPAPSPGQAGHRVPARPRRCPHSRRQTTSTATHAIVIKAVDGLKFDPDAVTVKSGETVTFQVVNETTLEHEFDVGDMAFQTAHEAEMEAMPAGMQMQDEPTAIVLDPERDEVHHVRLQQAGQPDFRVPPARPLHGGHEGDDHRHLTAARRPG